MRRLARYLFTLCSAASLVLCVLVVLFWVRSHDMRDQWDSYHGTLQQVIGSDSGRIEYFRYRYTRPTAADREWSWLTLKRGLIVPLSGLHGFHEVLGVGWDVQAQWSFAKPAPPYTISSREWWVPHWAAAVTLAALPTCRLAPLIRRCRGRCRTGHCPTCGYDLRASPERCPECGTATAAN
jgi:hypothetical protein